MKTSVIYLIHFDQPFKHARHYLGSTASTIARMRDHAKGNGSRLMSVIAAAGITWQVVRTWKGDKRDERKIKNQRNTPKLCPICNSKVRVSKLHL